MKSDRPLASISLDLDNLWSYMKIHGDAGWASFPSYLDPLVDIALERLERHGLTVTVFVVGQDAALAKNARAMRAIADAGHEIANHSFSHEPWFHTYSYDKIESEIADAETAIERATGQRPRGFRGPGFSLSDDTLRVLTEREYLYDASTFPTFIGPLARAYYFLNSGDLSKEEREKRKKLFGTMRDGLRDLRPYSFTSHMSSRELRRDSGDHAALCADPDSHELHRLPRDALFGPGARLHPCRAGPRAKSGSRALVSSAPARFPGQGSRERALVLSRDAEPYRLQAAVVRRGHDAHR